MFSLLPPALLTFWDDEVALGSEAWELSFLLELFFSTLTTFLEAELSFLEGFSDELVIAISFKGLCLSVIDSNCDDFMGTTTAAAAPDLALEDPLKWDTLVEDDYLMCDWERCLEEFTLELLWTKSW